ncbi:MAG: hypothetical protein F7B17_01960 [Desulfurococcales archaeon]|nr:hypothetical protein [Desulfurococcales archaeon]
MPSVGRGSKVSEVMKLLANEVNLKILSILSVKPSYVRELSRVLGRDETDIARRLSRLSDAGLVKGTWLRVGDKNVKVYELAVRSFKVSFSEGGAEVELGGGESLRFKVSSVFEPPRYGPLVGRGNELKFFREASKPIIHVYGPPGIGKSHLVSHFIRNNGLPAYWYSVSDDTTASAFSTKLGLVLAALGYKEGVGGDWGSSIAEVLARGIEATGLTLIIDDIHLAGRDLKSLIFGIAEAIESAKIFIISRERFEEVSRMPGKVAELRLGPLDLESFTSLMKSHGVTDDSKIVEVYRRWGGIPGLGKLIAENLRRGMPLLDASDSALQAYLEGILASMPQDYVRLAEVLSIAKAPVPSRVPCRIAGTECRRALKRLSYYGLADIRGEYVSPRGILIRYSRNLSPEKREAYARRLSQALLNSKEFIAKFRGFELASRECILDVLSKAIRNRFLYTLTWPFYNPPRYIASIDSALRCRTSLRDFMMLKAELVTMKLALDGDAKHFIENIKEPIDFFKRKDKPIYVKLSAIKCAFEAFRGNFEGAKEALEVYREFQSLPKKWKRPLAIHIIANVGIALYFIGMDAKAKSLYNELRKHVIETDDVEAYILTEAATTEDIRLRGEIDLVPQKAKPVIEASKKLGLKPAINMASLSLTFYYLYKGDLERAERQLRETMSNMVLGAYKGSTFIAAAFINLLKGDMNGYERYRSEASRLCADGKASYIDCLALKAVDMAVKGFRNEAYKIINEEMKLYAGPRMIAELVIERLGKAH